MQIRSYIAVKVEFDAIHSWKDCPIPEVSFLRCPHRHKFYVTVKVPVSHSDRAIEFFMLKAEVEEIIATLYQDRHGNIINLHSKSCEMVASDIIEGMRVCYPDLTFVMCSVYEDNENGTEIYWGEV